MSVKYNNTTASIIKYNNTELDKVIYGTGTVYQRITVNYYCENTVYRSVKVVSGNAVSLSSGNAASKSGWTFLGWRLDKTANGTVQSSIIAGTSTINLYAVYRQTVTVTYYNNSTTASSTSGYRYYNNGNVVNPSFKLTQSSRSGWNVRGWSTSTAANGSISYNNGATFSRDSNVTLYGMYQKTVTLSYSGNGATSGSTTSQSGTAYYNSRNVTTNPSFTLRSNGFSRTNYRFVNWRMGSSSGTAYNAGATVTLSNNTVFYASWEELYKAVSVKYQNSHTCQNDFAMIFPDTRYAGENWPPTIPANSCISFVNTSTRFCEIVANCNCTVTFSTERANHGYGSASTSQWRYYSTDGSSACRTSLFLNEGVYKDLVYGFFEQKGEKYFSWSASINLTTGQKASIRSWGGKSGSGNRMGIWGTLVIKATRR